jgi:hypothetical protein
LTSSFLGQESPTSKWRTTNQDQDRLLQLATGPQEEEADPLVDVTKETIEIAVTDLEVVAASNGKKSATKITMTATEETED